MLANDHGYGLMAMRLRVGVCLLLGLQRVWRWPFPVVPNFYQPRTFIYTSQMQKAMKEEFESPTVRLKKAFHLLDLKQDECTEQEIRQAYIKLAKKYHPDSSSGEANADHFNQVYG